MSSPQPPPPFTTPSSLITPTITHLQTLSLRGSWKQILDQTTTTQPTYPHERFIFLTFQTLSLLKLRRFTDIPTVISPDIFTNPNSLFQNYPSLYPHFNGTMIPFSLRFLHSLIPSLSPNANSTLSPLDPLYSLLTFTQQKLALSSDPLWLKREQTVISTIINCHVSRKEFSVCLDLLNRVILKDPDPIWLSKLGYVQLQYGDIEGAKSSFGKAEVGAKGEREFNMVKRNKAMMYMVAKDYVSAVREYEECVEKDKNDVVAVNNKALCLMYLRDLTDSIKVLENALESVPTVAVNETVVVNLCSMYELAFVNHADLKKTLSSWIARVAPDDFDTSCTRI